ncbi:MAG TPA: hypothetical protein VGH40_17530 [Roseiarcus sp.]|jgi:ElaB/YqjD/DUF883 family membrane-anchored ribosome-binding protein
MNEQKSDAGVTKQAADRVNDIGIAVGRDAEAFRNSVTRSASDLMDSVSARLRSVGVDPDTLGNAARDQAGELQRYVEGEIRHRPLRAVGLALALGAIVGFLTAR